MNKQKKSSDRKYKVIPVVLSSIILAVSIINLYLNYPNPNLEVGMFPIRGTVYSNTVTVTVNPANASGQSGQSLGTAHVGNETDTGNETNTGYSIYNFTYQVYNSGKGAAHDVKVSLVGNPAEAFSLLSTSVFVEEPLQSNLLDTVKNEYEIGLLGAGKSYTFLFSVKLLSDKAVGGKLVLTVTSSNAGTRTQEIEFR
jgi:hypothetical protein